MNARTLKSIVAEEMGSMKVVAIGRTDGDSQLRQTSWSKQLPGFGIRHMPADGGFTSFRPQCRGAHAPLRLAMPRF